ncbi:MAG: GNAT family N-acetyltransferase [Verrucomicrobiia bacterium]
MESKPALKTERLILRPLTLEDAPVVQHLAGRREIADTTISIPHPYSAQQARDWISGHMEARAQLKGMVFGVELTRTNQLIGTIGLREIDQEHLKAEMGFWIGMDWWGNGYATEAARRLIRYGFQELGLNRIYAHHMVRNPASGRVLEKIGMQREGLLRQRVRKWGRFEDVFMLAILSQDWANAQTTETGAQTQR